MDSTSHGVHIIWVPPLESEYCGRHLSGENAVESISDVKMSHGKYYVLNLSRINAVDAFSHE